MATVKWLENLGADDVGSVGGKNASLGEMIATLKDRGIRVPDGFALTAEAYRKYVDHSQLEGKIRDRLEAIGDGDDELAKAGKAVRRMFTSGTFPQDIDQDVRKAYRKLCERYEVDEVDVAVRSSATAEDLPEASFAGQQETYLNITGEDELMDACRRCYASLFTDRAIAYRREQGFDHMQVALSVGVQKMVRADRGGSGVMFTLDTDTGFPRVVVIDAAWGLGENVVQGAVNPDEYVVFKPLLERDDLAPIIDKSLGDKRKKMVYAAGGSGTTKNVDTSRGERGRYVLDDDQILELARWAATIEEHYERPMDIEWALDGNTGRLYIVQARPETVQSQKDTSTLKTYELKEEGDLLVEGLAIGDAVSAGPACVLDSADQIDDFEEGSILVTGMTDPDWVPIMKRSAGIVTDHGGRTSHAAIVSRELGIPAVVGTGDATTTIGNGADITISCTGGDRGQVYRGTLDYEEEEVDLESIPATRTRIMMNIGTPASAFRWWRLPCKGIGLARMEFIINNVIKAHPMALARLDELDDDEARHAIERLVSGYDDPTAYFVDHLAWGIARIAASQHPEPVVVRMSDFKSNEYADLIGGAGLEPEEANPMLGLRGASRYEHDRYRDGFSLECRAIRRVRDEMGLDNVIVMIPFCRTPEEADRVLEVMADTGLRRGENGLEVYVMAEIPSNVILADDFAERFDGFSVGSNDLTQLVLGVDRDSDLLSGLFDETHPAVRRSIRTLIEHAHQKDRKVGICGQAPSDHPAFAKFLVEAGIDSISLNPDSVMKVTEEVAEAEKGGT